MSWNFGLVNGRLAEIFFKNGKGPKVLRAEAHCYVDKKDYKTKKEQAWIAKEIKLFRFSYRNKKYASL